MTLKVTLAERFGGILCCNCEPKSPGLRMTPAVMLCNGDVCASCHRVFHFQNYMSCNNHNGVWEEPSGVRAMKIACETGIKKTEPKY